MRALASFPVTLRKSQLSRLHPVEQPSQHVGDLGDGFPERLGTDVVRRHASVLEEGIKIGQSGGHPFERLDRQPIDEVTRPWLPPRAGRVVVGPVQAARGARHRLERGRPARRADRP